MEAPEAHHAHPGHSGHRWLDIVLAVSAMFVSVISLFITVEHGRTMERMAEANARMVQANSWPFVEYDTHDLDEQGNAKVRLVLTNQGVGPARIETFELWWSGKPVASPWELLKACCEGATGTDTIFTGVTAPNILRAGEHKDFFAMSPGSEKSDLFEKLNFERHNITARICYCSVFDECWVSSGLAIRADRVPSCPAPAIPFRTDLRSPRDP
jgi:hypothetical protein